jgi:predicted nuclease with RNAse H fold
VDVGGRKKGFHAVALCDGGYHDQLSALEPQAVADWCRALGAHVVAVDAPCRWSLTGRARPAERALMAAGIWCFSTPSHECALAHPKNHYGWMLNGAALFECLEADFPLFAGDPTNGRRVSMETFPQAIACSLAGCVVSAKQKRPVRKKLLQAAGIVTEKLTNIDWLDAALCALAVERFLAGAFRVYGEAESGLIVVPNTAWERP